MSLAARPSDRRRRLRVFLTVGALGFLVQLGALGALMSLAHWGWLPATLLSVELAVVHNFFWHERWTWCDRTVAGSHLAGLDLAPPHIAPPHVAPSHVAPSHLALVVRLARFHVANGVVSIVGNAALMMLLVGLLGLPAIPANAIAVAIIGAANFVAADRWVFRAARTARCAASVVAVALAMPGSAFAGPPLETVAAWDRYVAATEARLERALASDAARARSRDAIAASGESIGVPSGTISDWHGSVFIRGVTLDRLLHRLQYPGTPPPQDDVVSSRVVARGQESLRVAIRLVRRTIVTVTYDTEHDMRFRRLSPTLAVARSVSTAIEEAGGADHGFLWRLNSYWRYEAVDGGVLVNLQSLTLSRDVPAIIRAVAQPIVDRIARESVVRTLEALRHHVEQ